MFSRRLKQLYFALEFLNAFATAYYFYYLFFFLRDHFGFGNAQNLGVCAVHGLVYTFAARLGGRFAQRAGYLNALPLGFGVMGAVLVAASLAPAAGAAGWIAQTLGVAVWTFGMSFTWPALEALACEQEPPDRLPRMIGIYNVTWAAGSALAYFFGGALMDHLGGRSLFWFPAALHGLQLVVVLAVRAKAEAQSVKAMPILRSSRREEAPFPICNLQSAICNRSEPPHVGCSSSERSSVVTKSFQRLAWLANPFAFVAINALVPVIPVLAEQLALTKTLAGFFCSVWFFARLGTFFLLWHWTGWHYRFAWMLGAFLLLIASFATILLVLNPAVIVTAQVAFGFAVGLIYYSSLFYSMDVSETKGEHGGIHEAAIGSGVFGGAALGAVGQVVVGSQAGSTWLVSAALVAGLAGLCVVRRKSRGT
ncbi:MAG: MFS transporter [Verrucomicrobia bacterium]|nr:MFS transporter [Verrucomicrobiota bacterium]